MFKLLPALLAGCLAVMAAAAAIAIAASKTVRVGDNWFVRSSGSHTVSVKRDTKVTWRFVGDTAHNVKVTSGPVRFSSPTKADGSFSKRMTRRGTYRIVCGIHGEEQRMTLRVR